MVSDILGYRPPAPWWERPLGWCLWALLILGPWCYGAYALVRDFILS